MMRLCTARIISLLIIVACGVRQSAAQGTTDILHSEALTISGIAQVLGQWAEGEAPDDFSLGAVRIKASGSLEGGFSYSVQADLTSTPTVIDARLTYSPDPGLRVSVGRFKSPLSAEFLTGTGNIDFVERSRIVENLATGRQIGAEATFRRGLLDLRGGVFTGARVDAEDDGAVAIGRMALQFVRRENMTLTLGVNAATGSDAAILPEAPVIFDGDADIIGADARFTSGRLLLSAEALRAHGRSGDAIELPHSGHQLTAGWTTTRRTQILARWDRVSGPGVVARDLLIAGFNFSPTSATRIQLNGVFPAEHDAAPRAAVVKFQVEF